MTPIAVDLDRLAELIDAMERFGAHLSHLRELTDMRVQALGDAWSGEAAGAHASAQARWAAGAADVHAALGALRSVAATSHANYTAAVTANRRMWAG
jgi:WXG100 family type VII secretion target